MAVKIPNSSASKMRNMRKTVVAGGETPEHARIGSTKKNCQLPS
jgi:hypothetical protein